jgi:hypothetical protein
VKTRSFALALVGFASAAQASPASDNASKRRELSNRIQRSKASAPPGATNEQPPKPLTAADVQPAAASALEVFQSSNCSDSLIVCITRDGALMDGDVWPSPRPGDKVTVIVITNVAADTDAVSVSFAGHKSDETLFAPDSDAEISLSLNHELNVDLNYVPLRFISDSIASDSIEVDVDFVRTGANSKDGTRSSHRLDVDLGYSYFSVALLVAATYKADRRVLRDLSTVSDHAVEPGLALNIFPGGRQRGVIGFVRRCTWDAPARCFANVVGFQVGTSLDLANATNKLYAGIVFEPIAGLALVGGVSLRKIAVVPSNGALPPIETTDGTSPSDSRYVVRGYIGLTFTLDLITTIAQVGGEIRKTVSQ